MAEESLPLYSVATSLNVYQTQVHITLCLTHKIDFYVSHGLATDCIATANPHFTGTHQYPLLQMTRDDFSQFISLKYPLVWSRVISNLIGTGVSKMAIALKVPLCA